MTTTVEGIFMLKQLSNFIEGASNKSSNLFFPRPGTTLNISPPKGNIYSPIFDKYTTTEEGMPMAFMSLTNVALQYIFNLRDFILSRSDSSISPDIKFVVIAILSYVTAVGYFILTLEEASLRFAVFTIAQIVHYIFAGVGLFICALTGETDGTTALLESLITSQTAIFIGFYSALQCLAQFATGVFASYHMLTLNKNLPKVSVVVSEATIGLQDAVVKTGNKFFNQFTSHRRAPS